MTKFDKEICEAINVALTKAAEESMNLMGYTVIEENGWIIKRYSDGKIEKLNKVPKLKGKIYLD